MLLSFIEELAMHISVFYFLFGLNFSSDKIKLFCSGLISILYCTYLILTPPLLPSTFVLAIILTLLFNQRASLSICLTVICTLCEIMAGYSLFAVFYFLSAVEKYDRSSVLSYIDYFLYSIIILFSLFIWKKRKHGKKIVQRIDRKDCWFMLIICFFSLLFLTMTEAFLTTQVTNKRFFLLAALLILIFTAVLLMVSAVLILFRHYNLRLQKINYLKQKCLELEKAHYLDIKANYNDIKTFRHNFNSHILALQSLVTLKEWSRLEEYITQLSVDKNIISLYNISTGNLIADAIINQFYHSLETDVQLKISGQFQEECFVEDTDLSIILYNLLNNAHEAFKFIGENRSKEIYLFISANPEEVTLMIENSSKPYTLWELEHLQTSKPDKENHGFGLSSVRKVSKKYNGNLRIQFADGFFTAAVILQNK